MKKNETGNVKKTKRKPYYTNKATVTVYLVLRALVILVLVRSALKGYYESVFLCGLTLFLMILPSVFSRRLQIELPGTLEIIILLFIFAAEILGEINSDIGRSLSSFDAEKNDMKLVIESYVTGSNKPLGVTFSLTGKDTSGQNS